MTDETLPEEAAETTPKQLRDHAARMAEDAKQAQAELAEAQRQLAFLKAGIDPDDPKAKYFVRGYDGETSPDAIRQAALEAGFLEAPPAEIPDEEQQAHANMVRAAAPPPTVPVGSEQQTVAALQDAYRNQRMDSEEIAKWLESQGHQVSYEGIAGAGEAIGNVLPIQ